MKKVVLVLLMVGSLFAGKLTSDQEDVAKTILTKMGYACKKVDSGAVLWDGGVSVFCNNYAHSYVIRNMGGHLEVEVRK